MIDPRHLGPLVLLGVLGSVSARADGLPPDPGLTNPVAARSLESLSATRERPLFSPTRRPPPPLVVVTRPTLPPVPVPPPSLVLLGIVTDDGGPRAMMRGGAAGKIVRAGLGEMIDGWKVVEIDARRLVLSHDDRSVTLALFTGTKGGDADPVQVARPMDAAGTRIQEITDRSASRR
jgi:hypothetical protein